jgi:putative ABC transport system permease protein
MSNSLRYALFLTFRNLRTRAVQSVLTILVVALATGLGVAVLALTDGVQQGIIRAADAFGVLVIGPKGNSQQLVLNSILLQGEPIGLVDQSVYEELPKRFPAITVVPLAFADNLRGLSIIGTTLDFFGLRRTAISPPAFQVQTGRLFNAEFEAVLGSESAARLGLRLGDQFRSSHGASGKSLASDEHTEHAYTVVGILAPTYSPYDRAIFTSIDSIWEAHADLANIPAAFQADPARDAQRLIKGRVTAALVLPYQATLNDVYRISQQINSGSVAQAVFPGQQLAGVFDLIRQGTSVLDAVRGLALIMAALTVLLSLYATTTARLNPIAIMRGVGAGRSLIFGITILEAVCLAGAGVIGGWALGHTVAAGVGSALSGGSALPIETRILWSEEIGLLLIPVILGAIAGVIPAVRAYRVDVTEHLYV